MKTEIELKTELEKLKQTHGKVRELVVFLDTDDETKTATIFLKKPDKTTRSMVNKFIMQDKFSIAVEACLKALHIGGDELNLVISNDDAIESAGMGVVELLTVQKAILKKN
jgi:thiamine monophosphate synthase